MSGRLYFTGDTHGDPLRFGYRNFPESRQFGEDDIMVICGDCGFVWNYEFTKCSNQDRYSLKWLNDKGYIFIMVCGNHENFNVIEQMPQVKKFNGIVRQCVYEGVVYENLFYIDKPTTLDLNGSHCLVIPKADSRDKEYREENYSWWPQEKGDITAEREFVESHMGEYFDFVITHDCCAEMDNVRRPDGCPGGLANTPREIFFDELRVKLEYGCWVHGHMHEEALIYDGCDGKPAICIYHKIFSDDDIVNITDDFRHSLIT